MSPVLIARSIKFLSGQTGLLEARQVEIESHVYLGISMPYTYWVYAGYFCQLDADLDIEEGILRKCSSMAVFSLWRIFLISDWGRRAQTIVGGPEVQEKAAEPVMCSSSVKSTWPCPLLWFFLP